jgi:hypothetical protein
MSAINPNTIPTNYTPQQTLQYSTFIKRTLIEATRDALVNHPSATVVATDVTMNLPRTKASFPSIVIKLYEREMPNAGVGHYEYVLNPNFPPEEQIYTKVYHRMYKGDIEWAIYALSPVDRDIVRDALIEVLAMQELTVGGNAFVTRLYDDLNIVPYGAWHYPVLNLDLITGYGEAESMPSWAPEDSLVYSVKYRVPIFGEFYSNIPTEPVGVGFVEEVDVYPWATSVSGEAIDPPPTDTPLGGDPNSISGGIYRFTGWRGGTEEI